jgi:dTDP-4-dehydrorhamnose reductase
MFPLILGKGFVGSHFTDHLQKNNLVYSAFSQQELDYTNPQTLYKILSENKQNFNYVINCFGYTGVPNVDACETNKEICYNYNVLYPLQVVKICHSLDIPVIHIGSGCIYNGYDKKYTENDSPDFGFFSNDSSYYSKCKHLFETLIKDYNSYVLRIRIPFTSDSSSKNYFTKLLKYNTLINELNSITSITDFNDFLIHFMDSKPEYGIYNVVNPEPVKAKEVVKILKNNNIVNPNWEYISLKKLKTVAKRSNCILDDQKITDIGLKLPNTIASLERDIKLYSSSCTQQ